MKKTLVLVLALVLAVATFAACTPAVTPVTPVTPDAPVEPAKPVEETPAVVAPVANTFEYALVTDLGHIDDKSFNQGAWEGLVKFAEENGVTYKYYQPTEATTDAYVATIDLAIKGGAKVCVCPGYLFEPSVYVAQDKYPEIKFVLLDGFPQDGTYTDFRIEKNVLSIFYAEEQSGFLAGYAAVKDGMTKFGYMGGMAVPAVIRFGYGFVQGVDFAAKELDVKCTISYNYLGGFGPSPEFQAKAASWYQSGIEVIFAAAGGAGSSVMAAADQAGKKSIGVDVDQSGESPSVITSAMKGLQISVYDALILVRDGKFEGGKSIVMAAAEDGIGLPMASSRFTKFTQADYDAIYAKLVSGEIKVLTDKDVESAAKIPVTNVKVTEVQ